MEQRETRRKRQARAASYQPQKSSPSHALTLSRSATMSAIKKLNCMRGRNRVSRFIVCSFLLQSLCGWLFPVGADTRKKETELDGFYVATHVVSDASPFRYEYILDVRPEASAVLVRQIRIAPGKYGCPGTLSIKAADRRIMNSSAQDVARINICSLDPDEVTSAIERSIPEGVTSIEDTASYTIVARCGTTEKVFELPFHEEVDFKTLKRINPRVASLWDLSRRVSARAFGKNFSFYDASAAEEADFRALGAQIFPELKSGTYSRAFAKGDLENFLKDYSGPGEEIDPWQVELIFPERTEWAQYRLPKYPPLARQTRIQGEVRLVAAIDAETGLVKDVKATSGYPLLAQSAIPTVKEWQFRQTNPPKDSVEVGIRFALRCP
jgi:hypothetical protein